MHFKFIKEESHLNTSFQIFHSFETRLGDRIILASLLDYFLVKLLLSLWVDRQVVEEEGDGVAGGVDPRHHPVDGHHHRDVQLPLVRQDQLLQHALLALLARLQLQVGRGLFNVLLGNLHDLQGCSVKPIERGRWQVPDN